MSFATLRRLRYVVLISTRADSAASQRYVVGNGINAFKALFTNSRYSCNILHQILSVRKSKTWSLQLENSTYPDVAHEG